jgi:hypothetical protein
MPLNTRDVMRSDDHDSSSQLPIVFRYGTGSLAVMILGFPILLAMFVLFPIMSVHQLMRPVSIRHETRRGSGVWTRARVWLDMFCHNTYLAFVLHFL